MNNNRDMVKTLTEQIRELRLALDKIERIIERHLGEREIPIIENQERGPPTDPLVHNRGRNAIHLGFQVIFLTRGLDNSTTGRVYKVLVTGSRVTTRDQSERSISRRPNNFRVIPSR